MTPAVLSPVVSIVTPVFNVEHFLEQTIESVLRQTFTDFEMLIVDDGSTDGTKAVAQRHAERDARIRVLQQPNRGIAAARNRALASARGRYIALLDGDDLYLPSYLDEQVGLLARNPGIAALSANALNFGGPFDGEPLLRVANDGRIRSLSLKSLIQKEDSVSIFTTFRRELLDTVGGFDETLRRSEDYDLWLRAAAAGLLIAVNPAPLALYRRRPGSLSADEALMLDAMGQPLTKVREACRDRGDIQSVVDAQLATIAERQLLARARSALIEGDMREMGMRFAALAEATGASRYRVASWLSRRAPATIRWAYRCKRTLGQLSRTRRRAATRRTLPQRLRNRRADI